MASQFHNYPSRREMHEAINEAVKQHGQRAIGNVVDAFAGFPPPMKPKPPAPEPVSDEFSPNPGKTYDESFRPLSVRMQALDSVVTVPFLRSLVGQTKELEQRVAEAELRANLYRSKLLGTGRWGMWWDEINLKLARWLLR